MGWWGYGVMDGDGPSDAEFMIKVRAVSGTVKDNKFADEFAREVVDEYDGKKYDGSLAREDRELMATYVRENVNVIVDGAIKDARGSWLYGGPAELIATAYMLVNEYGVKKLPKQIKPMLERAFEEELGEEADNFDSPQARRAAVRNAQRVINRAL